MAAAVRIAVLTPFPLQERAVKGGAERAARSVCDALLALGNACVVLRSEVWHEPAAGIANPLDARYVGQWTTSSPVIETRASAAQVRQLLGAVDLVVSVDRAFAAWETSARRALLLSNLAYANERTAADARWDAVWVPSPYLADELRRRGCGRSIHVVPPAVGDGVEDRPPLPVLDRLSTQLDAAGVARHRRLLFPHRADPGKGLTEVVELLARLWREESTWHLVVSRHSHEGDGGEATLRAAFDLCEAFGVSEAVSWLPWLPAWAMPQLYDLGGCTIVASQLPEAFSLVSLESLVAGVPVVARPVGNIASLARRFASIHAVETIASTAGANCVRTVAGRAPTPQERSLASQDFSVDAHRSALDSALRMVMGS